MPRSLRSRRVEALILRHSDWGEADRLLVLYTRELGKVRAVAKGVRKLSSRKAGHLEPFMQSSLLLAQGKDLWIVTQAEMMEAFQPLRESLELTGFAAYTAELIDRFVVEELADPSLYTLAQQTWKRLSEGEDALLVVRFFELKLLDRVGFRPLLFQCAVCGEEIKPQDQYFSAAQGGAVCPRCGMNSPGAREISMNALKYLRHLQRSEWGTARRAQIPVHIHTEMQTMMHEYMAYLLERRLKSTEFLRQIIP